MAIKQDFLTEKRNVLNEIRANSMSLQELRFFSIYLSKINSRDINTRLVRFTLNDFQKIMNLGRPNLQYLKTIIDNLLCKVVGVPLEQGGFTRFPLFKECTVSFNKDNEWYIEIDANDKALPLMFEFKDKYFTYELWNALRLKSSNQLRMYEILKQYEKVGERIISVRELKELLGISSSEYERFGDFKVHVLNVCQKALSEHTDLKFSYEPHGKRGKGGKILHLKFILAKNKDYVDQLSLSEFLHQQDMDEAYEEREETEVKNKYLNFLAEACDNEFSTTEMQLLYDLVMQVVSYKINQNNQVEWYAYLKRKYDELVWRAGRTTVSNRFAYLVKIIKADMILS